MTSRIAEAQIEEQRLAKLKACEILDTPPEETFDRLTQLAAQICDAPVAMVSLIDEERQWFKSCIGWEIQETPRDVAFCAHAIQADDLFLVPDALLDERFRNNSLVVASPNIRSYAGAPLILSSGERIGTLCVIHQSKTELSQKQLSQLQLLSQSVVDLIEMRNGLKGMMQLEEALGEAKEIAEKANKTKSEFLAVMSHEMRTPLNGILGLLELLQASTLDNRQRYHVEQAVFSGELLLQHINDFLDLSQIEAGKMAYEVEPIDLSEIVDQVLKVGSAAAEANENLIESRVWPGLTGLMGDAHRIRQVLLNAFNNAGKFTYRGRILVTVTLKSASEHSVDVEFAVSDSGIGIPVEERANVFDDFITLDSGFNRSNSGSGLGLAICHRIVTGMGGSIGVSDGINGGTRLWFRLPLERAKSPEQLPSDDVSVPVLYDDLHVLIVEDNELNRTVAREMLRSAGIRVSEAQDGHEGVALAEKQHFDLMLMDISMPGIDGIETTRRIRSGNGINAETPIIGLTAHVLPEVRKAVIEVGMQDCLPKPVRRKDLLSLISSYASTSRAHAEGRTDSRSDEIPLFTNDIFSDLATHLPGTMLQTTLGKASDEIEALTSRLASIEPADDLSELVVAVHSAAGVAALVGASRLHKHLSKLENSIRGGELGSAKDSLSTVIVSANASLEILRQKMGLER